MSEMPAEFWLDVGMLLGMCQVLPEVDETIASGVIGRIAKLAEQLAQIGEPRGKRTMPAALRGSAFVNPVDAQDNFV